MTDQELIARLLDAETDLTDCAVDYIEQTQAKLIYAMEVLRHYATCPVEEIGREARAVLAELEKTS